MFDEKLYSINDVAKITKLTDRTIRNYLARGYLKGHKIGGQWRFSEQNLNSLLSNEQLHMNLKNKVASQFSEFYLSNDSCNEKICLIFKKQIKNKEKKEKFLTKLAHQEGVSFIDEQDMIKIVVISSIKNVENIIQFIKKEEQ